MGENCAIAMKFEILGFYRYGGQASAHIVCSDEPGPSIFSGGGFSTLGWASLGEISILKIIVFLMIFPSFSWYIHIMLLHSITLTSNFITGSGKWT